MRCISGLLFLLLVSCGGPQILEVRQFHLRKTDAGKVGGIDAMIRGEMNKRLYGAVTMEEREARLGQYYNVSWSGLAGCEPVVLRFEYGQAATGSQIRKVEQDFGAAAGGEAAFKVTGENYRRGGRVTSWQLTLLEGGVEKASRRSYLWK